jgi:uncharacterized protein (DUF983 family)
VPGACEVCGRDLSAQDAGDGRAIFSILFLGLIVVGLAALIEIRFSPPIRVRVPLFLGGAVAMLRPPKAGLIRAILPPPARRVAIVLNRPPPA